MVVLAGLAVGMIVLGTGVWQLLRNPAAAGKGTRPAGNAKYAVYIAAPMAGFGDDEAGRKQGTELVSAAQASLQKLLPVNPFTRRRWCGLTAGISKRRPPRSTGNAKHCMRQNAMCWCSRPSTRRLRAC